MVFKRFRKRVTYAKKKTWYGRRYMSKGGAARLVRDVKRIKGMLNSELHHVDSTQSAFFVSPSGTNWTIYRLNELITGDQATSGQRTGMQVKFKSLQIRGRLDIRPGTNTNPVRVRVVVFIDKEPLQSGLAGFPNVAELYQSPSVSSGYVNSMRTWTNIQTQRFAILKDLTLLMDDDAPERFFKIYSRLNMTTKYQEGYTAGDAINKNAVYIAFLSDAGLEECAGDFNSRLTYRDN